MLELFVKHPEYLIPTVAIVAIALVVLVAILSAQWRAVRQADTEASLKHDMLNRGLSVEEIERVLRASSTPDEVERADPISDNEYYLVEKLVDEGKSAEEVERVLRVFRTTEANPARKQRNLTTAVTPAEAQRI